jgi:hypothetical protein
MRDGLVAKGMRRVGWLAVGALGAAALACGGDNGGHASDEATRNAQATTAESQTTVAGGGAAALPTPTRAAGSPTATATPEVKIIKGANHTVLHHVAPLPSASSPRTDGKPTLVWFSAPT